jgi:cellulose synthase/poly-beta-1,6-N-acetylglucosamine synthase-like glycosyltransferase
MIESLFWICVAAILYTYVWYPIAVWLLGRYRNTEIRKADVTPRVSVVIACHNEQSNIAARIKNLAECDYPRDLVEIVIVSDGSTDRTAEIARRQPSDRVRVLAYDEQKGKAIALNAGVGMLRARSLSSPMPGSRLSPERSRSWLRTSRTRASELCPGSCCLTAAVAP